MRSIILTGQALEVVQAHKTEIERIRAELADGQRRLQERTRWTIETVCQAMGVDPRGNWTIDVEYFELHGLAFLNGDEPVKERGDAKRKTDNSGGGPAGPRQH